MLPPLFIYYEWERRERCSGRIQNSRMLVTFRFSHTTRPLIVERLHSFSIIFESPCAVIHPASCCIHCRKAIQVQRSPHCLCHMTQITFRNHRIKTGGLQMTCTFSYPTFPLTRNMIDASLNQRVLLIRKGNNALLLKCDIVGSESPNFL